MIWSNPIRRNEVNKVSTNSNQTEIEKTRLLKEKLAKEQRLAMLTRRKQALESGEALGKSTASFFKVGIKQPDFSREQMALQSMFGGGDKIWGTEMQPVKLNHDLNPRQRGDNGTASLFGFG